MRLPFAIGAIALAAGCSTSSLDQVQEEQSRRLLPYIEAAGTPQERTRVIWLSPTRVAFTAVKPSVDWREGERRESDVLHRLRTRVEEVRVFDIGSRDTVRHADGMLRSYDDGILTIVRVEVLPDGYYKRGDARGAYDLRLVGPPGEEREIRHSREGDYKPAPAKCPANRQGATAMRALKPEHGCLIELQRGESLYSSYWVYDRVNGDAVELPVRAPDVGSPLWIDWLGAYLLRDWVTMSEGRSGATTQSVSMMKPDGRLLTIDMKTWTLIDVRPTRAGMTAVRLLPGMAPEASGIYLWLAGKSVQIAEGHILEVAVSPDGCRLAYALQDRPKMTWRRLRVIDVCQGLDRKAGTNPFEW
jgi:hypothetical protein